MVYRVFLLFLSSVICMRMEDETMTKMSKEERGLLKEEARSMFYHAYDAYMHNAYPADELMPLSCKGRWKGVTPSRGDLDDTLGNFSLTLIDSLDMLALIGDFAEFSNGIKLVLRDVSFDTDVVVSVFETNIRVLGGLLSAHVLATSLKTEISDLQWYNGELLALAEDVGKRLLPAFNTSTGIPHGRINLKYGIAGMKESRETCTACAGTMILEMAALSRLTGRPLYEQKAHKAMDRLWKMRHRTSDLMGTVINIHSGDWVRKDSGVGAGIDSYYEYCLKAYILLGDEKYLARFNRHYNAIMKYISRGPVMVDVHMHRPHMQSRSFMDALLAFWPGLQVLLGDVRPAVETHEMLYQVMQRHTFIPEAFTSDFQVHWGQHPLRPEFLESTYFLHRATNDDHYLDVGKSVLKSLQQYAKVPCGYAAVNDVRTRVHEDRMDSFVLAETFKYLYLLFGEDSELPIKLEDYVLTTEAHLLPLSLSTVGRNVTYFKLNENNDNKYRKTCPNTASLVAEKVRQPLRQLLGATAARPPARLMPMNDPRQVHALADLGISVLTLQDGRVQLLYSTSSAKTAKDAAEGLTFMREMSKWNSLSDTENGVLASGVKVNDVILPAGPSHFGRTISGNDRYVGKVVIVEPINACTEIHNKLALEGNFGLSKRGDCSFAQKARILNEAGAKVVIITDNLPDTSQSNSALFAMSEDEKGEVDIPAVFLFSKEAAVLISAMEDNPELEVTVGELDSLNSEHGSLSVTTEQGHSVNHLKEVLTNLVTQYDLKHSNEINNSKGNLKYEYLEQDDTIAAVLTDSSSRVVDEYEHSYENLNQDDNIAAVLTDSSSVVDEFKRSYEHQQDDTVAAVLTDSSSVVDEFKRSYEHQQDDTVAAVLTDSSSVVDEFKRSYEHQQDETIAAVLTDSSSVVDEFKRSYEQLNQDDTVAAVLTDSSSVVDEFKRSYEQLNQDDTVAAVLTDSSSVVDEFKRSYEQLNQDDTVAAVLTDSSSVVDEYERSSVENVQHNVIKQDENNEKDEL